MNSLSNLIFKTKSYGIMFDREFILKRCNKKVSISGENGWMRNMWIWMNEKRTELDIFQRLVWQQHQFCHHEETTHASCLQIGQFSVKMGMRERQTDRWTDRDRDRQSKCTHKHVHKHTLQTQTQIHTHTNPKYKYKYKHEYKYKNKHKHKHTIAPSWIKLHSMP